jgi:UDP-glucose 4-epimerase
VKKKLLITGGNGYIGSVLVLNVIKKYSVFIIDKKKKDFFKNKKINFIKANLLNYNRVFFIIKKIKPDIIIHLSAQSTIDMVKQKKNSYLLNNILATQNIVTISKKLNIKKFIFSSTASVYKKKNTKLYENDSLQPNNLYGESKLQNEEYIKKNLFFTNTKYCILRFFNVCGADKKNKIGEFHNPETHLLPIIVKKILCGEQILIYGNNYRTLDGTCVRDYIHVLDIVSGIIKSIDYLNYNSSNIFNLGSKKGVSVLQLINIASKIIKKKAIIRYTNRRFGDVDKLICNYNKAKKKLNWSPIRSSPFRIVRDELYWFRYLGNKKFQRKFLY